MKRVVIALSAAVLFFSTFVVPAVRADGMPTGTNCGNQLCKP